MTIITNYSTKNNKNLKMTFKNNFNPNNKTWMSQTGVNNAIKNTKKNPMISK